MQVFEDLQQEVSSWDRVTTHPHRFGGCEFRLGNAEIGHVHTRGMVDIPFTRPMRDALVDESLAEQHHWVPNSGWITFRVRNERDLPHALWLMRLSYIRYALKSAEDPDKFLANESENLHLNARFKSLLALLVPVRKSISDQPKRSLV